jgi:glucose-6-phosphate isomerase
MASPSFWQRFQKYFVIYKDLDFSIDVSRMRFPDSFFAEMERPIEKAFEAMKQLEAGAIANPDEGRMVGHYWLRNPKIAPTAELRTEIVDTNVRIIQFARDVHSGKIAPERGGRFEHILLIGIGGSALGPQFIADALGNPSDPLDIHFFDNTDPNGFERTFRRLGSNLEKTLTVVISKSGGTKETRNGMVETAARYKAAGLDFAKHAVAVTGRGSDLDKHAEHEGWLARFPMHDWVGGRTSVMSPVGLVPAALEGFNTEQFLAGAAAMDAKTRVPKAMENAAMLLALMWFYIGNGRGEKDMVILPYKDRLMLFSRYLQQLVMESLGKEKDLEGKIVHQGIAVYGNKGSTDQHAYVQQLRDGVLNFFVTFIEVRKDAHGPSIAVEDGVTSGDYLQGFLRGTRAALYEKERESITITIPDVDAFTVGALIALYERAVGFYASLININAYHQPGVEAGKKAATRILELEKKVKDMLGQGQKQTVDEIAQSLGADPEDVFHIIRHLEANGSAITSYEGNDIGSSRYSRPK